MNAPAGTPVVFVHGLWLHATSWEPWVEYFAARGYEPIAPGWPGEPPTAEEARANPDTVAGYGIGDIADHYSEIISGLASPPVVIGHSFGGLVAQRLHGMGVSRACVVLSPAQFKGNLALPPTQLRTAWPVLSRPGLRKKTWSHSADSFARTFANAVPRPESDALYAAYGIPSPARPLFQASVANVSLRSEASVDTRRERGPVLLIAAGKDRTVPEATVRAAYRIQSRNPGVTELRVFPDRGHSMGADAGWREIADTALEFLTRHDVATSTGVGHG
ncbi:alpha/beta hydrolase [Blastococcus tunisiensis]|uniref:Lysophospholipase, alpha-beta hydrolase superfamily n=1 Tax=Blastococcus tunisiensis TaxID=1798228 RepID=A0A1I2KY38_9ACTN|nr:alpha/beta fold hydrolase [Blastococcus sp. DSM 46838]SFF71483.1 Lysophospholipase, alpha-beta hydrolase superfamily [Blastococcus sp. DSM 46838]